MLRSATLFAALAILTAGCADLVPPGLIEPPARPAPEPVPVAGTLEVHYVDVGQGDGTIWRFPDGNVVVYDCGESVAEGAFSPMVAQLQAFNVTRIHSLIVSHGHADHAGACVDVLETFDVERVVDGWYAGDDATRTYRAFKDAALAEGAHLFTLRDAPGATLLRAGDALPVPQGEARLLWPGVPMARSWDDIEVESLVVRLVWGEVAFCFQGDIGASEEAALARSGFAPDCEVVLAGHHGSRGASTDAWLARLDPEVAVVSFGENTYGHPTSEAMCRLQQAGAALYFTHRLGTVGVRTDGATIQVPEGAETADHCAVGASYW